jgi:signal transduction histidine kinase
MAIVYDFELDVRNRACPYPLISTKYQIAELPSGAILKVLTTDQNAWKNIYEWLKESGNELIGVFLEGDNVTKSSYYSIYIRKPRLKIISKEDPLSILIASRDLALQVKMEEIQREKQELAQASKAKSEFLATMSHELKTPLNAIIGFSELLKGKMAGELNKKQEHFVDNVLTSAKHLLNLINDILDLSKIEAGKIELTKEKTPVASAIEGALSFIKETALKHNVILKKELDPEVEFIETDLIRFRQILINLLSNAVKFSKPEGGVVTIRTKKEGESAKISVEDNGIGIKEEDMVKLFNEFEQLDSGISRKYGGTGLGLAITKRLVQRHGGKIWVESTYGEGSTFMFLLPIKATNSNLNNPVLLSGHEGI